MNHLYVFVMGWALLLAPILSFSQEYTLTAEEYIIDGIPGETTYRFYIDMVNDDDFLSSGYGGAMDPMSITTTTGFYNDTFATGATADGVNPSFFAFFPTLEFDSWLTIGISGAPVGDEVAISALESTTQPFLGCFNATSPLAGTDITVDDETGGAWYVLNGTPNGLPDENNRVLFMQMTTPGEICATINFQIFEHGDGQNGDIRFTYTFCGTGTFSPDSNAGCMDEMACNYDETAEEEDGSCFYAESEYDCDGICLDDADGDGVCDSFEVLGCTEMTACNYDMDATDDDDSCELPETGYDCDGACLSDVDMDGVCDEFEIAGCQDATACNYSAAATDEDGSCTYADAGYDCDGNCLSDTDGDSVCDEFEVAGCQDATACNYDADATDEDGSCTYADAGYDCDGNCLMDADGDGVCDEFEIAGCSDMEACNYDETATDNDGSCTYAEEWYDCDGVCLLDQDADGICDQFEVGGCTDAMACNYDEMATDDNGSCIYAEEFLDCNGNCLMDTDGDGVCDEFEVAGCQDETACNYDSTATDEDGSCTYAEASYDCDGNCLMDADGDGVCDEFEIAGCSDMEACNYDDTATDDDGSCVYADDFYDCDGNCLMDTDGDGVCDELEVAGCMDPDAANYNADATDDDGSCYFCDVVIVVDEVVNDVDGAGGSISITVSGGTPDYEFSWSGPDGFMSSDEDITGIGGMYTLTVIDSNGCETIIEVEIEVVISVLEMMSFEISTFPNPATQDLWIVSPALMEMVAVELYDASGRLVYAEESLVSNGSLHVDVSSFSAGTYNVIVHAGEKQASQQVVIQ